MKLTIDPATGISGDMLVAALLDAAARLAGGDAAARRIVEAMRFAGGLLGTAEIKPEKITRGRTTGTRLVSRLEKNDQSLSADRLHEKLAAVFHKFDFTGSEINFAERAFDILSRAEEQAHNRIDGHDRSHHKPANDAGHHVHLHEAQDILLDIAGSSLALGFLKIDLKHVVCFSPVHFGGGAVSFSHGTFAVPAPAVGAVIESFGIPTAPGPVCKELLTPTGASLLAALAPRYVARDSLAGLDAATEGIGLGTMEFTDPSGHENCLMVYLSNG